MNYQKKKTTDHANILSHTLAEHLDIHIFSWVETTLTRRCRGIRRTRRREEGSSPHCRAGWCWPRVQPGRSPCPHYHLCRPGNKTTDVNSCLVFLLIWQCYSRSQFLMPPQQQQSDSWSADTKIHILHTQSLWIIYYNSSTTQQKVSCDHINGHSLRGLDVHSHPWVPSNYPHPPLERLPIKSSVLTTGCYDNTIDKEEKHTNQPHVQGTRLSGWNPCPNLGCLQ